MVSSLPLLLALVGATPPANSPDRLADATAVAVKIDAIVQQHWRESDVKAAPVCSDADFLRRLTLDLAGRIPTAKEAREFIEDRSADKRLRAVRRLMDGPEYALQLGRVLDEIIQGKYAGDPEFVQY